jgi:hypothetical protein
MALDLDKHDLISLVKGQEPSFDAMSYSLVSKNGSYSGSYGTWTWSYSLKDLDEETLLEIYKICKDNRYKWK